MESEERTVQVKLDHDEEYPVYSVDKDLRSHGTTIEIPYDLYCEYLSAKALWLRIQEKLRVVDNAVSGHSASPQED
jgi:hypothetical protein